MNRSKKKSFDWYGARQRFSIRKYHIGAASVLLGTTLVLGTGTIVGAETGVNGDGASNEQIVPVSNDGISDGTQPQGDNQGVNSSGVQTGNTTNSTANDQSANDTGSASSQPVGTSRSANTGTQGDGTTNPTVDEPIIKFPTQDNQAQPDGYQKVEFSTYFSTLVFEGKPGEIQNGKSKKFVFWVKTGTTWGALKRDPQFRMPKYTVGDGDFILGYARSVGGNLQYIDFNSLDDTAIVDTWQINTVVDYIVGDVKDGKTFEEYMNSGSYAKFHIPQFHGITLDANGGTIDGKEKKAFYVAYQHVQWGDQLVTKKIDDASNKASRDGYTFVRWQTATGEGIPTSGKIETTEFSAVWLKHPTEAVKVFNPAQLSETDKTKVADLIRSVNPDLQNSIQEITVANNGDATVRFTTGEERTISGASLVSDNSAEQRTKARDSILDAVLQKQDDIAKSQLTAEEQQDKLDELRKLQESIEEQIDGATSEDALDKIVEDGKNSIENFDLTSATKKDQAKQDLEKAYNAEKAEIENSVLTVDEKSTKQAELTTAKEKAIKAVDDATTDSAVEGALKNGKATIESTYTAVIKFPSSTSETAPQGYVTVTFGKHKYTRGFTLGTQTGETVKVFVKNGVKWGELLDDPAWQWPTVKTDEGDTVVGWSVNDYNYKPGNAFARDKYKDVVVTNTTLYPNVVFEVEDVGGNGTKEGYLAQYGPDEQNKWIFITFDAGQGQLKNQKKSKMVAVSKNLYSIDFSNKKFKEKVESPTLQGHTFVRWQTEDGVVLPESGEITTDTTYKALYLAHPTDKTTVFDANKLTETEKDSLKQAISNANPTSANLIQSITVSDTGEATVTYNDGTVVTVPATALIFEDKEPARNLAKADIDKVATEKVAEINASALTDEEKVAKLTEVQDAKDRANNAIDNATTTEDLTKALEDGKSAIAGIDTSTSPKKAAAKEELKAAAEDAKKAIDANDNLTDAEKQAAKDAVDAEVAKAEEAIDAATSAEEVETATLAGEKAVAKEELKAAVEDAKKAIDANPNLSDAEKQAAKDAVDASAAAANKAIDGSTSSVEVQAAKDKGNAAIAENVLDAAKQGAKNKLMEEADKAKAAIDANPNLTPEEKAAAKAEIDKAVEEAIISINGAGTHHALGEIKLPLSALIKPVVTVTPVLDPNNLTEEEIARIKALLEENNTFPEGTEIIVSKDASVSIKYPDGSIDLILPAEIVKQADTTAPAITDDAKGNIVVAPTKEAVEFVVTYVDNNGKAQLVVVTKGADGKWTTTAKAVIVDPVTGQVIIPGSAIKPGTVVTAYSKDMAGNVSDLNSAEVEAVDANNPAAGVKVKSVTSTSNANKSTKKAKQLPNTGEEATSATSLGLAVLGMGLALFAAKRKKDEEEA